MKTRIAIIIALALTTAACANDPIAEAAPTTPTTTTETAKFNPPEETATTTDPTTTTAPADLAPGELPPLIPNPVIDGGRTDDEAAAAGEGPFSPSKEDREQFRLFAKMYEQYRQIKFQSASPPNPDYPGLERYTFDGGAGRRLHLEEMRDKGEMWVLGGDAESTPEYWDENIRMFLRVTGREHVTLLYCTTVWAYPVNADGEQTVGNPGPWEPRLRSVDFRRGSDGQWGVWEESTSKVDAECVNQEHYEL